MRLMLSAHAALVTTATIAHHLMHTARRFTPILSTVLSTGIVVVHNRKPNLYIFLIDRTDAKDAGKLSKERNYDNQPCLGNA